MPHQSARLKTADLPGLLQQFVRVAEPQGAWLAITHNGVLRVAAAWRGTDLDGKSFAISGNTMLRRMQRTRQHVVSNRGSGEWPDLPHPVPTTSSYWACFPLVREHLATGALGIWGKRKLRVQDLAKLRQLTRRLAREVQVAATLRLLGTELLDMTAGSKPGAGDFADLPRAAEIALRHVASFLDAPDISLFVPRLERRLVYEFRLAGRRFSSLASPLTGGFAATQPGNHASTFRGASRNSTRRAGADQFTQTITLGSHGRTVGAVVLWGGSRTVPPDGTEAIRAALSRPLAKLIEKHRPPADSQVRSGRLELIRDLSPQVIGLTDPRQVAQIAASRVSQHFGHETTRLVLIDRSSADLVMATAGAGLAPGPALSSFFMTDPANGIASQVLRTGRSLLVRGRAPAPQATARAGRTNESHVCVALNQGGHILGIVELRSPRSDAFTRDDLHDVECAAAIVAAVLSAAGRSAAAENVGPSFGAGTTPTETRLTSQHLPENRLLQAAKLMSVGEMAAGIAHELNNPLTTVSGFAELLLEEIPADAPFRADVEMVMQEAQRARGVVRRLLDFARQGEGVRARADIGEIVEDVLALTTHFMHTSGVKLDLELAKNLPWALVDSNQMKQVFLNLIHNALQAMPAGGNLRVRTEASQTEDRQWVVVRFADNGLGIRPSDMSRIFEPFFTTRAQHGGTGLGLSVSYGIVAEHGGKIEVESQPGVGSTFSVWLPG